jgi:protein TonB
MRHPSAEVRRLVAEAIGGVPEAAPPTRTGLVRLATDPDPGVRVAAVAALGGDHESEESRAAVVRAVDDVNRRVSWQALQTLGRFRSSAASVRPVIAQKLESPDRYLRAAAIAGLVQLQGSTHPDQVAPILDRIRENDPDAELRTLAAAYHSALSGARAPGQGAESGGVPPPPPPLPAVPEPPLEPDPRGASTVRKATPAGGMAPPKVLRVGGTIKEPRKIKDVRPVYPDIAYQARVQGYVVLECTIGADGRVSDVKVVRGIPLLDQAAIDAVSQWVYEPVLMNGVPVAVIMTVTVSFRVDVTPQ